MMGMSLVGPLRYLATILKILDYFHPQSFWALVAFMTPVIDFRLLCRRSGVAVRGVRPDADYRAQGFQGTGISRAARITRSCHLQSAFGHAAEFHSMALRSEMVGRCAPQWCGTETGRETDCSCLGPSAHTSYSRQRRSSPRDVLLPNRLDPPLCCCFTHSSGQRIILARSKTLVVPASRLSAAPSMQRIARSLLVAR